MPYDNTNKGALWKNDKREKETHPHFRGQINVQGTEYYVSMWWDKDAKGTKKPTFRLALTPVNGNRGEQTQRTPTPQQSFDDDIPF